MSNSSVYIIAEIGVNHNGNIETAKKLIDKAKEAGVDAVKFQSFTSENEKIRNAPLAEYQKENTNYKDAFEMSKKLELSIEEHIKLKKYCDKKKITFLSTGFDKDNVDLLDNLGVELFKIPSGEINNFPLIKHIALKNKPIIVSTGMANLAEIDECITYIRNYNNKKLTILHCVSLYPCNFDKLNLKFLATLNRIYDDCIIGFSDHSIGEEASIASIALGARVIEKHITLDKTMEGPDHKASMDCEELKHFVASIRNIEKALGSNLKKISEEEMRVREVSRKSIVVEKNIKEGERFTIENLSIKKPGNGIPSKYLKNIINRVATTNLKKDTILTLEMVGSIKNDG
ncbi:N-acetylneuraminate synthase [Haloimpatiens sp. FM7330]|uniref:N-acetylneuraminate synthase n=1 Tax=Haloimpatiens sp. FM7330 TaxID=3298610 RepID=UPI00363E439D